jgi:hypothetical protein
LLSTFARVAHGIGVEHPCSAEVGTRGQRVAGQDEMVAGLERLTRAHLPAMTEHPCSVTVVTCGHRRPRTMSPVGRPSGSRYFAYQTGPRTRSARNT